jgi:hypothetical protein
MRMIRVGANFAHWMSGYCLAVVTIENPEMSKTGVDWVWITIDDAVH